jgi:hypothetical protein
MCLCQFSDALVYINHRAVPTHGTWVSCLKNQSILLLVPPQFSLFWFCSVYLRWRRLKSKCLARPARAFWSPANLFLILRTKVPKDCRTYSHIYAGLVGSHALHRCAGASLPIRMAIRHFIGDSVWHQCCR